MKLGFPIFMPTAGQAIAQPAVIHGNAIGFLETYTFY